MIDSELNDCLYIDDQVLEKMEQEQAGGEGTSFTTTQD